MNRKWCPMARAGHAPWARSVPEAHGARPVGTKGRAPSPLSCPLQGWSRQSQALLEQGLSLRIDVPVTARRDLWRCR